jgi:glycosyltransferase involved in cell wall biosynthesis
MKPKLTLCMIVKNESHIIHECLESIYKYIDYWVVSDTGSTDGTQDIIRKFFESKGIPGEIHQDEWKNFGHNRTLALNHCQGKAEYAWMIDADDKVEGNFKFPENPDGDAYVVRMGREDFSWWRTQIFKVDSKWEYRGVLHEYPSCTTNDKPVLVKIEGKYNINARTLGARNVGITVIEKYKKDAELLEKALIDEPTNTRYQFYLAQSYFDSQQWEKAIEAYMRRAQSGGWPEEVYYSLYRIAICRAMLDRPWSEIQASFLDAYNYRPIRAEPLIHIAQALRTKFDQPAAAFVFARIAAEIPFPTTEILFVPDLLYRFTALDELGAVAHAAGRPELGYLACKKLLEDGRVPEEHLTRVQNNYKHYQTIMQKLAEEKMKLEAASTKVVDVIKKPKKFKDKKKLKN